jgi:hypothetical protein
LITSHRNKIFWKQDPLGKTLIFYSGEKYEMPLTVTGVLKDVPINSTMQFRFITNFENYLQGDGSKIAPDNWSWMLDAAFSKSLIRLMSLVSQNHWKNICRYRIKQEWIGRLQL